MRSARRGVASAGRTWSGSSGRSGRSSSASGCTPRSARAFVRPCSTISSRSTIRSGAPRGPSRCTPARHATPPRRATSSSRTPASPRRDLVDVLGIEEDRIVQAPPGLPDGLGPDGDAADLGGPAILALGTIEPRKNLARLVEAWRLLADGARARPRRRRGLGRPARPRRPAHPAARLRAGRGDRAALPGRGRLRVPVDLRGVRHADRRGDGVRDARRRLDAPVAGRGLRRRGRARRSARCRSRSPRGSARRSRGATSSSRSASRTRRGSRGRSTGAAMLAALEERA